MSSYWMPPEWAPQDATFLTWPHRPEIWRGLHDACEAAFAEIAARMTEAQPLYISVPDVAWARRVREKVLRAGGVREHLHILLIDSDDVWCRDHGPTVVFREDAGVSRRVFIDWEFNAWGGKYPALLDQQVTEKLALALGFESVKLDIVMEGGGIETNGAGDLLTTESVLLNANRNPHLSQAQIEASLRTYLGVSNIIWLGDGLTGDDTDGHIDDLSRFTDDRTIVTVLPDDRSHHDYATLAENARRLREAQPAGGGRFEVRELPMPEPVDFQGELLPASYANFYIGNGQVLVPTFAQPSDARALSILQECFPDRRVHGIDCRAVVSQYGAIHCISQQLPSASAARR